jgi:hypothetical protein
MARDSAWGNVGIIVLMVGIQRRMKISFRPALARTTARSRRRVTAAHGRAPNAEPTSTAPVHQGAAPCSSVDMRRRMP